MAADPVPRFRAWLLDDGHATEDELAAHRGRDRRREIDDAVAVRARQPAARRRPSCDTDVYAEVA